VFGALILQISRNPFLKDELFKMAILRFVLIKAIAICNVIQGKSSKYISNFFKSN
jgi:F0F1-type ATP synthase membrane subunit c/vacuolar-type H+-ATPase subunit K